MTMPLFGEDPDPPEPVAEFFHHLDQEVQIVHVRDEPLGLEPVAKKLVILDDLSLPEICHALRLKGEYHKAIELELERFRLRQVGKVLRDNAPDRDGALRRLHRGG